MDNNIAAIQKLIGEYILPAFMIDQKAVATLMGVYYMTKMTEMGLVTGGMHQVSEKGVIWAERIIESGWIFPLELATWFVETNPAFEGASKDERAGMAAMLHHVSEVGIDAMINEMNDLWNNLSEEGRAEVMKDFEEYKKSQQ